MPAPRSYVENPHVNCKNFPLPAKPPTNAEDAGCKTSLARGLSRSKGPISSPGEVCRKKGGFRSVEEEEWFWGRQQLLGEIPTHPMKETGLGKKKRTMRRIRDLWVRPRERPGGAFILWDGEGCVRAGRLSPDGD